MTDQNPDRTPPRRITDREIDEHSQALYASADGHRAADHRWLDGLVSALKGERAYVKRLELVLREVDDALSARFESYNVGDRPSSPPAWLIGLSAKVAGMVEGTISQPVSEAERAAAAASLATPAPAPASSPADRPQAIFPTARVLVGRPSVDEVCAAIGVIVTRWEKGEIDLETAHAQLVLLSGSAK